MKPALILAAICFLAYSLWNAQRRPGFLVSFAINGYLVSPLLGGGVGAGATLLSAAIAIAHWPLLRKTFEFRKNEIFLLLWFLLSVFSVVVSIRPDMAGFDAVSLIVFGLGSYIVGRTFGDDEKFVLDLVVGCGIGLAIGGPEIIRETAAALQYASGSRLGVGTDVSTIGVSVSCELPIIGGLCALIFPEVVAIRPRILLLVGALLALPIALGVGARAFVISIGLVVVVFLVIRSQKQNYAKLLGRISAGSAVLGLFLLALWPIIADTRAGKILSFGFGRFGMNFGGEGVVAALDASTLYRLWLWHNAWEMFVNSPIIGRGLGATQILGDTVDKLYPHNIFLEVLSNTGLIGGALLFFPIFWLLGRSSMRAWTHFESFSALIVAALLLENFARVQVAESIFFSKLLFLGLGMANAPNPSERSQGTATLATGAPNSV